MPGKEKLSVTVDRTVADAARTAVSAGRAPSVSAWVNAALRWQLAQERRAPVLDRFMTDDAEQEHSGS
ncbi:hypothetical protein [Kribbella yunnanensis]